MTSAQLTTVILGLVLIEVTGQGEISHCGQLQQDHTALMAGSQPTHRWPWHAAIFHLKNEQEITYQCGGTVISPNTILTAAHCVCKRNRPMDQNKISISLGRLNLSDDNETSAQWPTVAEIISHPNYHSYFYSNDIAIIRLSTDIKFNKFVQPICLWSANKTNFSEIDGRVGTVVGWGQTAAGEPSKELLHAALPVISPVACLQSHRSFVGNYLSETNFCAGLRNGTNICLGDSGGSMTFKESEIYYIRGIVSVGPTKFNVTANYLTCDSMAYALFTDVARYLPWITSNCVQNVHCSTWGSNWQCDIVLTKKHSQQPCGIVFDIISSVTKLFIHGDEDDLPDISDAFRKFINLESLAVDKFKLKNVGRARLTNFSNITELNLNSNQISQLAPDTFDDLIQLRSLKLIYNQIEILPASIFHNIQTLEKVDLSHNRLKEFHADTFKELPNLQSLRLTYNQLESLPASIFHNIPNLKEVVLSHNRLKELHNDSFKELPNLHSLWLDVNQFEILPASIFNNNQKLEYIELSRNRLKELQADTFKELTNLQTLWLNGNELEILPASIFHNNQKLDHISLSDNKLKELQADTFRELSNLQTLVLNGNLFEMLPENIFHNNQELVWIQINFNKLKELHADTFKELSNLQSLEINGNLLEILPANIFHNNQELEQITLDDNNLKELQADIFKELPNLRSLGLNGNQFEILPANIFHNNQKLKWIDMRFNKLKELHANTFKGLPNLETPVGIEDVCSGHCHVLA